MHLEKKYRLIIYRTTLKGMHQIYIYVLIDYLFTDGNEEYSLEYRIICSI